MNSSTPARAELFPSWMRSRTVQYTTLGVIAGMFFPVIAMALRLGELQLPFTLPNMFMVQEAERVIWITDTAPFFLGLVAWLAGRRQDMVLQANRDSVEREAELRVTRLSLEQSINDRTQELDRRNMQMRAVIDFARQIAAIQDLPTLLSVSVDIIGERFQPYEARLYLLDEGGRAAVLRAASSQSGKASVKEGFHVPVGDQGAVGRVLRRGKLIITAEPRHERTPPSSPSLATQVTLPLVVRSRVTGVLDLGSREPVSAGAAEIEILQLIADQLAASIENVRLVASSKATVNQLEALAAQGTTGAWQQYLKNRNMAYQFTPAGVVPVSTPLSVDGAAAYDAPLLLRGQKIGSLTLRRRSGAPWMPTDRELVEKVAAQVALALENARLLEETSQKAAQEQRVIEISARLNRSLEVDAVLQAAVREFAALPEVAEAEVRLSVADEPAAKASR